MSKCKICGGSCFLNRKGEYECECCGATFSESELSQTTTRNKTSNNAVKNNNDAGAQLYENNINGVLEVFTRTGSGSGYLISSLGYAITNSHVVSNNDGTSCGDCTVKIAGEMIPARVIAMGTEKNSEHCSNNDLAILKLSKLPKKYSVLKLANYDEVKTGERIYVIGNSMGYGTCITSGIVSDKSRGGQLLHDCPTNPGNSGGPVFNADGLIIGTHVAGIRPNGEKVQGMNLAIPSTYTALLLKKYNINY